MDGKMFPDAFADTALDAVPALPAIDPAAFAHALIGIAIALLVMLALTDRVLRR